MDFILVGRRKRKAEFPQGPTGDWFPRRTDSNFISNGRMFLVALALAVMMSGGIAHAQSSALDGLEQKLKRERQSVNEAEKRLSASRITRKTLEGSLNKLDYESTESTNKISKIEPELRALGKQMRRATRKKINELAESAAELSKSISRLKVGLEKDKKKRSVTEAELAKAKIAESKYAADLKSSLAAQKRAYDDFAKSMKEAAKNGTVTQKDLKKLDTLKPSGMSVKDKSIEPDSVYATFAGSFEGCLTDDKRVVAIQSQKASIKRHLPCRGLKRGHAIKGGDTCLIQNKVYIEVYNYKEKVYTGRVGRWPNNAGGGVWTGRCETIRETIEKGGGFTAGRSSPFEVCNYYGKSKLNIIMEETSIFIRHNWTSLDTTCFYIKKKDVASLLEEAKLSDVQRGIRNIQKEITKIEEYITKEEAFADAIDDYKLGTAIKKQDREMSLASEKIHELKEFRDNADSAIDIWRATRKKIENIPADNTTANSAVASLLVSEAAQKEFRLAVPFLAGTAKYGTAVGIIGTVLAMPIERAWKESVRKDYVKKVDGEIQKWENVRNNVNHMINKYDGLYWAAHRAREDLKSDVKSKEVFERNISNARDKIRALQLKQNDLATGRTPARTDR
jgi:hypothetical protein